MSERRIKVTQYCKGVNGPVTRDSSSPDLNLCSDPSCTNCRNLDNAIRKHALSETIGHCPKHPGQSFINCLICYMEKPNYLYYSCKNLKMVKYDLKKDPIPRCNDKTCETCEGFRKAEKELEELARKMIFGK